jgi:Exportin 1-like protein
VYGPEQEKEKGLSDRRERDDRCLLAGDRKKVRKAKKKEKKKGGKRVGKKGREGRSPPFEPFLFFLFLSFASPQKATTTKKGRFFSRPRYVPAQGEEKFESRERKKRESSLPMAGQQTDEAAVRVSLWALYFSPEVNSDPAQVTELSDGLLRFREDGRAWAAADALLRLSEDECASGIAALAIGQPGAAHRQLFLENVRVFAAQTLREKVVNSLRELPDSDARGHIRDAVLEHVQVLAPELNSTQGGKQVVAILGQVLAALAVQLFAMEEKIPGTDTIVREWPAPVEDCAERLSGGLTQALALLEVLTEIPIMVDSGRIRSLIPRYAISQFEEYMYGRGTYVLELLTNFLSAAQQAQQQALAEGGAATADIAAVAADPVAVQVSVFRCLEQWIFSGQFSANDLASNGLVVGAFDAIHVPELFDSSAEVIVGLIRRCNKVEETPAEAELVITNVLQLLPSWQEVCCRVP